MGQQPPEEKAALDEAVSLQLHHDPAQAVWCGTTSNFSMQTSVPWAPVPGLG